MQLYLIIDFISLSLVKSLGLISYIKTKYYYIKPTFKDINKIILKTYSFYYLKLRIINY